MKYKNWLFKLAKENPLCAFHEKWLRLSQEQRDAANESYFTWEAAHPSSNYEEWKTSAGSPEDALKQFMLVEADPTKRDKTCPMCQHPNRYKLDNG